jgi:hypothetical protein
MSENREVEVPVLEAKEYWNEYKLEDGTTFRMKVVLSSILRIEGQYNEDGQPLYQAKLNLVPDVRAPEDLRKRSGQ